jgi:hypothetical protein
MTDYFHLPTDLHKLGTVIYNNTTPVEEIDKKNLLEYQLSKLTAPTTSNPVYAQNIQILLISMEHNSLSYYYNCKHINNIC